MRHTQTRTYSPIDTRCRNYIQFFRFVLFNFLKLFTVQGNARINVLYFVVRSVKFFLLLLPFRWLIAIASFGFRNKFEYPFMVRSFFIDFFFRGWLRWQRRWRFVIESSMCARLGERTKCERNSIKTSKRCDGESENRVCARARRTTAN